MTEENLRIYPSTHQLALHENTDAQHTENGLLLLVSKFPKTFLKSSTQVNEK